MSSFNIKPSVTRRCYPQCRALVPGNKPRVSTGRARHRENAIKPSTLPDRGQIPSDQPTGLGAGNNRTTRQAAHTECSCRDEPPAELRGGYTPSRVSLANSSSLGGPLSTGPLSRSSLASSACYPDGSQKSPSRLSGKSLALAEFD